MNITIEVETYMNVCIMPERKIRPRKFPMTDLKTAASRSALDASIRRAAWLRGLMLAVSLIATALVIAGCARGDEHNTKGGFPPAPVSVQEVKEVTVPIQFEYVGQTAGSKEAEVRARVQGVLERRTYQEGGYVKSGQLLFVIDPRPYAAQLQAAEADLSRAQAQYAQAKRNFDRVKPLADSNALSRREYDEAVSSEEIGAAAVKQAQARLTEARLNLGYTTVSSPVNGYASRAQKSEGSLVTPGDESLLTTVSQVDPIHVKFSVSEQEQLTEPAALVRQACCPRARRALEERLFGFRSGFPTPLRGLGRWT
jgi:membrane fusion protein (multidrug efflux system)